MPFTFSHASIVLPLNRKPFILSALIIGSFSPDISYFIPYISLSNFSHTIIGIFYFSLPIGFFTFKVLHRLILGSLENILPNHIWNLYLAKSTEKTNMLKYHFWVLISLLIGILTHLVLDSFTHRSGPAVLKYGYLSNVLFNVFGEPIYIYKLLQYLGSILGGLVLVYWLIKKYFESELLKLIMYEMFKYNKIILFITISSILIGIGYGYTWLTNFGVKAFIVKSVIGTISTFAIIIFIFSILFHFKGKINLSN